MERPDLVKLAQTGKNQAIADLLNHDLHAHDIEISVDREGSRLSIGLYKDDPTDLQSLIPQVIHPIAELNLPSLQSINLFGYQTGNLTPLWSRRIETAQISEYLAANPQSTQRNGSMAEGNPQVDRFIVCGLGSLGQYCVYNLKRFAARDVDVQVIAIDRTLPQELEVENLTALLDGEPLMGDCRSDEILLRAGIQHCRAILLVTSDESDNIEAAIAARRLNPRIRLVVRSSRQSLNQLLKQQLGNFAAFEPTELPAAAFAMAGLQQGILGFFHIGDHRLQVVQQVVQPRDYRFDGLTAAHIHKKNYRLLSYAPVAVPAPPTRAFYQWQADTRIQAGDAIAYVEVLEQTSRQPAAEPTTDASLQHMWQEMQTLARGNFQHRLAQFWQWIQANQTRRLIALGLTSALLMGSLGTILLKLNVPDLSWQKAISSGAILLLGGFGDVFGGLANDPVPWWVALVSFLITLFSLLFVLGALGLIADSLLASRFSFLRKRIPIPKQDHIVVVGLGRVGQKVASLLREFKHPFVAMTEQLDHPNQFTQFPIVAGDLITELANVNLATAKSVIVVTDDQMLNLEVALMAREAAQQMHRQIGLIIRTYGQRFSNNLDNLLPDAKVLAAYGLSGEAFAGAAFGENILGLFQLNEQTILVTEYQIAENDSLAGKLMSQASYGYGVVPVFHQRGIQPLTGDLSEHLLPSDDRQLQAGDRLIVLASINGLRRIERGEITPPRYWRLDAQKPLNENVLFFCGNDLAKISGCSLDAARLFMEHLPGAIELPLYEYQAYRLQKELGKHIPLTLVEVNDPDQT